MNYGITNLRYTESSNSRNTYVLEFDDEFYPQTGAKYHVFVNGNLLGSTTNNSFVLSLISGQNQISVVKTDQAVNLRGSLIEFLPEFGRRLFLSWSKCLTRDFASYIIYFKKVTDADYVIMNEVTNVNQLSCSTPELLEFTDYNFKMEYKDFIGNISNNHVVFTKQINKLPITIDDLEVTHHYYDNFVLLTATEPTEPSDIAYYQLYSNYNPYTNELFEGFPNEPVETFYSGFGTINYTQQVFPGNWQWKIVSVDKSNLQAESETISLTINDDLSTGDIVPLKPQSVNAVPIIAGIKIIAIIPKIEDITDVIFGIIDASGTQTESSQPYTESIQSHSFTTLTNAETYHTYAYYANNDSTSEITMGNDVTVDSAAPIGDSLLTIGVI